MNTNLASMEAQLIELYKEREALAGHFPGLSVEEIAELARGLDAKIHAHLELDLEDLLELKKALRKAFPGVSTAEAVRIVALGGTAGAAEAEASLEAQLCSLYEEKARLAAIFPNPAPEAIAESIQRKATLLDALEEAA